MSAHGLTWRKNYWLASAIAVFVVPSSAFAAESAPAYCPAAPVRYGVVPSDASADYVPLHDQIGNLISAKLGCPVGVKIDASYVATIQPMPSRKFDSAEFGSPFCVLADAVSRADAVATYADAERKPDTYTASMVTWPGSGVRTLNEVEGHSFAYSDPSSTSGYLSPVLGLSEVGLDPDKGVCAVYACSHTGSFEARLNHKVEASEINSRDITSAQVAEVWNPNALVTL